MFDTAINLFVAVLCANLHQAMLISIDDFILKSIPFELFRIAHLSEF